MKTKTQKNPIVYCALEKLYSIYLKLSRDCNKFPLIDEQAIMHIQAIEASAYPPEFRCYTDITSVNDFVQYCSCFDKSQIFYLLTDDWYFILVARHDCTKIFDFAGRGGHCGEIWKVIQYVKKNFGKHILRTYARESTSYRLLKTFELHGKIGVLSDEKIMKGNELFHVIEFQITKENG